MQRSAWRFWTVAATLIALNAGGWIWFGTPRVSPESARPVRVAATWPVDEADDAERLSLTFDRAVASTADVGRVVPAPPFTIEPQPAGRWVYGAPERIDFELAAPLPPGRVFTVRARTGTFGAFRAMDADASYGFRTRALAVDACRLVTADRHNVHVTLEFNQPVDPRAVAQRLVVKSDRDGELPADVLTDRVGPRVDVRVPRPRANAIDIALDATLTGAGATRGLDEPWTTWLAIPTHFVALRATSRAMTLKTPGTVDLAFSAPLDTDQTAPAIVVSPPVDELGVTVRRRSVRLRGAFRPETRYEITIPAGVLAANGTALDAATTLTCTTPRPSPALTFDHRGGVLSPDGNRRITGSALSVGSLSVTASRVHVNNLVDHVRGEGARETSRVLPGRTVTLDEVPNEPHAFTLALDDLLEDPRPGVYRIAARALDTRWTRASMLVRLSDLAITTKEDPRGVLVWVTSVRTGAPVADATVTAWSYTNQMLATGTTDRDGVARLAVSPNHPDGPLYLVTAAVGEDVSYIQPGRRAWSVGSEGASGRAPVATYDVMLYTERGAYRPGDPIHVSGIARAAGGTTPEGLPLALRAIRPDGRVVLDTPVVTGAHGTFAHTWATGVDDQMGTYRFVAALPGARDVLGAVEASVEAFVPVRIALDATPAQPAFGPGVPLRIDASAQYLFGRPAAGLPVTLEVTHMPMRYVSARHPDFVFGPAPDPTPRPSPTVHGVTDDDGRVALEGPAAPDGTYCRTTAVVTVTEVGGRSVSHTATCTGDGAGHHLGLGRRDDGLVASGRTVTVPWCLVGGDDAPRPAAALRAELERIERNWVLEERDDGRRWTAVERTQPVFAETIAPGTPGASEGSIDVTFPSPGRYRLTVTEIALGARACIDLNAVAQLDDTPASTRPDRVEIVLDRADYVAGTPVGVVIRSPFAGSLLVTLEDGDVRTHRVVELAQRTTELTLPLPADVRGDAFVTATVVRAVDPSAASWRPHRANGMVRVRTRHDAHTLPLVLATPTAGRPGATCAVEAYVAGFVDPTRPPVVQLWAVDEGILRATGYGTPAPRDHFFAPRRATVGSADLFGMLLPDRAPAGLATGGDEAGWRARSRRGPVPTRRAAPAVVWHDWRPVDADGRARFDVALPVTNGALRIMAVAVDGDRYAHADARVTVTAPLLVDATWPRAVAPGDCFRVPVRVQRTDDVPVRATVTASVDGPVIVRSSDGLDVDLTERASARVWLEVEAYAAGPVHAVLDAATATEHARDETAFLVRTPTPHRAMHEIVRLDAPGEHRFAPPAELDRGRTRCVLRVGTTPRFALTPAVRELIDYPYGCVEQTTSRLYAMLHAPDLLDPPSAAPAGGEQSAAAVRAMIDAGISRLWSMQTPGGGLSYWPGRDRASCWASAYVALFLERARQRGHAVDAAFTDDLATYLRQQLGSTRSSATPNVRAMICRVLAMRGAPDTAAMATLGDRLGELDVAGRAHLAAAWLHAGRRDRAMDALPDATLGLSIAIAAGDRPTSQCAQDAVLLDVLLDLDPAHPWIGVLVERLASARRNGSWGSTRATAAALSALTRHDTHVRRDGASAGVITVGGRSVPFDDATPARVVYDAIDGTATVQATGTGPVYVTFTAEGPQVAPVDETIDHGVRVRARWTDRHGVAIDPSAVRVGDLIRVEIELAADRRTDNVAVVAPLPGGFEVEHPRLVTSAGAARTDTAGADRVEFLDDRVLLFATARTASRTYVFAARAVTAGSFRRPAVEATCMYDPSLTSIHAGGEMEIAP